LLQTGDNLKEHLEVAAVVEGVVAEAVAVVLSVAAEDHQGVVAEVGVEVVVVLEGEAGSRCILSLMFFLKHHSCPIGNFHVLVT